jgi:predicted NAD/FAD-dependent oxidoreductase
MSVPLRGHQRIDQRSLALHRAIAEKLRAHPALLEIARDNLDRWTLMQSRSQPYWDAWRKILSRPLPEILELLGEESERMTALRQATPFAGVLEPAERWAIYARFEPDRPGAS